MLFVGAVTYLHLVSSQCTREILNDAMVVAPLVARSLVAGTQSTPPTLIILGHTIVCLSVDNNLLRYRGASLVVMYTCTGACPTSSGNTNFELTT